MVLSDAGRKNIKRLIKKHGFLSVYEATEKSIEKYAKSSLSDSDNFNACYSKIEFIINYSKMPDEEKKISYIVGICKNKFRVDSPWILKDLIKKYAENYDLDDLKKRIINNEFNHLTHLKSFLL